jgi:glycosyltransferase involved in cell wall biosynthesis
MPEKMKKPVAVLYVDYYSFIGGGQVNLLSVFKALDRRRYVPVLAVPQEGPFAEAARRLKVETHILPMKKARWRLVWQAWPAMRRIEDLIREKNIGLVHANCYPAAKLAGPAARRAGIPSLWHKQIAVTQKPGSTTGRLWRFFSGFSDLILAVSQQGFNGLKALGIPERKLRLLYNNADVGALNKVKALSGSRLRKLGLPSRGRLILAAGMRRPHKGFDIFLGAARQLLLRPGFPRDIFFALLGDPTPAEAAHEAYLKRLQADLVFQGRLFVLPAQKDLAAWLKRAEVCVSSSRWEGSPLVVIEAMALGRPIVATFEAGAEILADGKEALLVPADDPLALARAVERLIKDSALSRRLGKNAALRAGQRHSLKAYALKLAALYDELRQGRTA